MTTPNESAEPRLSTADVAGATREREAPPESMSTTSVAEAQPVTPRMEDRAQDAVRQQPLFEGAEGDQFRGRWSDIQASFVDEPRRAVEQADGLVAEVMQRLATVFADERKRLEQQWDRGGETDTEELRLALRRYRAFFDRLLTIQSNS